MTVADTVFAIALLVIAFAVAPINALFVFRYDPLATCRLLEVADEPGKRTVGVGVCRHPFPRTATNPTGEHDVMNIDISVTWRSNR